MTLKLYKDNSLKEYLCVLSNEPDAINYWIFSFPYTIFDDKYRNCLIKIMTDKRYVVAIDFTTIHRKRHVLHVPNEPIESILIKLDLSGN